MSDMENIVVCQDNIQFMRSLPSKSIDLIYIDPPFFTQRDFGQFKDIWKGLEDYLNFMRPRLRECHRLLKTTGSFFLHSDWHACHYLKCELDKVFGYKFFRNEIIWIYAGKGLKNVTKHFARNKGSLLFYTKSDHAKLFLKNGVIPESVSKRWGKYMDSEGKITFQKLIDSGENLELKKAKASFNRKYKRSPKPSDVARDYSKGSIINDTWSDIPIVRENRMYKEYLGYPTQKPEKLLERIIKACSNEGDIVADFFCGSGTTLVAAKKLGRSCIGCDTSEKAIKISKERLEID